MRRLLLLPSSHPNTDTTMALNRHHSQRPSYLLPLVMAILFSAIRVREIFIANNYLFIPVITEEWNLPTTSNNRIDIVLSVFDQKQAGSLDHVRRWMQETSLHTLKPRFFVYNKNKEQPSGNSTRDALSSIGVESSQIFQETLTNFGREGHTYLHHISKYYNIIEDGLADHTIFCQPHMADADLNTSICRMNDYYFNSTEQITGFLPLDLVLICDCSGKGCLIPGEGGPHLSGFFPLFQDMMCPERWSGALRGCFLVSRTRIKRNSLKKYQYIKYLMETPADHFINAHSDWQKQAENTAFVSYSNPFFGHSLERAWSIIFNCSSFPLDKPVCFD